MRVDKVIHGICDCVCVRALKEKPLEQSTRNLVHIYSMTGPRHELTGGQRVQGHVVMKCAAGAGMRVGMTA